MRISVEEGCVGRHKLCLTERFRGRLLWLLTRSAARSGRNACVAAFGTVQNVSSTRAPLPQRLSNGYRHAVVSN
jgi:hypothetical protein